MFLISPTPPPTEPVDKAAKSPGRVSPLTSGETDENHFFRNPVFGKNPSREASIEPHTIPFGDGMG